MAIEKKANWIFWISVERFLQGNSEFRFLRFVGRARGRGSPRFAAARRPLASKKWKRPLVSHAGGGGEISCISALSTNNVYRRWSSANPTTPGAQAIPRLVIACYRVSPSCLSLSFLPSFLPSRIYIYPSFDKLRQNARC